MKIENNNPLSSVKATKRKNTGNSSNIDFDSFIDDDTSINTSPEITNTSNINLMFILEEINHNNKENLEQAKKRGDDLLDSLNQLRISIISGALSKQQLSNLQAKLKAPNLFIEDPKLKDILDEIEVRTAVEIAKLEVNGFI